MPKISSARIAFWALILLLGVVLFFARRASISGVRQSEAPRDAVRRRSPGNPNMKAESPATSSNGRPIPGISALVSSEVEKANERTKRILLMKSQADAMRSYWAEEDRAIADRPDYPSVREEMRRLAEERVKNALLAWSDVDAVTALAQEEIDAFWNGGGLLSADAYKHAYLARAMVELALERDPGNFRLLAFAKEAISAANPLSSTLEKGRKSEATELLMAIVEKQKKTIEAGKWKPDALAYDAMSDWLCLTAASWSPVSIAERAKAYDWLIENARVGGWERLVPEMEHMKSEEARLDDKIVGVLGYTWIGDLRRKTTPEIMAVRFSHARRLPSHKGSPFHRSHVKRSYEVEGLTFFYGPPAESRPSR